MSKKTKDARPTVGAVGRAVENGSVCETAQPSTTNDTTSTAERQTFRVVDLLHPGAENAVPRRDLVAMTGYTDRE